MNSINGLLKSIFHLSIEKPKPKLFHRPVRAKVYFIISQWELKVEISKLTESQLFLVLHLIGWEDVAIFLDQSQSKFQWNQTNPWLFSTLDWKFLSSSYGRIIIIFRFFFQHMREGSSKIWRLVWYICARTRFWAWVLRFVVCVMLNFT